MGRTAQSHSPNHDLAVIQARIVRYLLRRGGSRNVGEIRYSCVGLATAPGDLLWTALRRLVDSGQVLWSYETYERDFNGFADRCTYPVFWVLAPGRLGGGDG